MNAKTGSFSEASSSEEENIGMRKGRRKSDFENTNKELNGSSIEEEDIKSPKCGRKGNVETVNEETKEAIVKRKRLEYVSVGEKVELIKSMRK